MVAMTSPNGVAVEAHDAAVENLLAMGFKRAGAKKTEKKAAPKAAAKTKE